MNNNEMKQGQCYFLKLRVLEKNSEEVMFEMLNENVEIENIGLPHYLLKFLMTWEELNQQNPEQQ